MADDTDQPLVLATGKGGNYWISAASWPTNFPPGPPTNGFDLEDQSTELALEDSSGLITLEG